MVLTDKLWQHTNMTAMHVVITLLLQPPIQKIYIAEDYFLILFQWNICSMSLGGLKYDPVDDAVDAAVERGVHFSISAGNDNSDACAKSPAASELRLASSNNPK